MMKHSPKRKYDKKLFPADCMCGPITHMLASNSFSLSTGNALVSHNGKLNLK